MKSIIVLLTTGFLISLSSQLHAQDWAIKAKIAESCSCDPVCPCFFGSDPTRGHCHANQLIQIEEGHYDNVNLDGLDVVISFKMGGWSRLYVNENASDKQVQAIKQLFPIAFQYDKHGMDLKSIQKSKVSVVRNSKKLKYSTPFSAVAIERMDGPNGKPIRVENIIYPNYVQYKSTENRYEDGGHDFNYSGTNGFTATIDVSSED